MKHLTDYIQQPINEAKTIDELKDKLAKLKLGDQIPVIFVVREKLTEPHNSGAWMVDHSLSIYKDKSFPRRIEKYYFVCTFVNDGDTVIKHMYKAVDKKYVEDVMKEGFSLEQIYKMLDSLPNGMIPGSKQDVWYGHYISETEAMKKCQELTKPYQITKLEDKIKATEQAIKDLEKMKVELQKLKEEKYEDE